MAKYLLLVGGASVLRRAAHRDGVNESLLRELVPAVIGVLVRRGADFAAAEDAVQDALVEAVRVWPDDPPRHPRGWLVTVAWRTFVDAARAVAVAEVPAEVPRRRGQARSSR